MERFTDSPLLCRREQNMVELATTTPLQDNGIAQAPFQLISSLLATVCLRHRIGYKRIAWYQRAPLCAEGQFVAANGAGGSTIDAVAAAGAPATVWGDVHGLQPPLPVSSTIVAGARPLHVHRPAHLETQRGKTAPAFCPPHPFAHIARVRKNSNSADNFAFMFGIYSLL